MIMISLDVCGTSKSCALRNGALTDACAKRDTEPTFGSSKRANDKPASKFVVSLRIRQS